ncbi:uncharacterized protein BJX67DRAFT_23886 [Aspergillus lucknowensis]|uniref:Synaptobrevin n=1 Tax=Aspergillus lucknowensis TaxID=176173 RepID=A0ABR4M0Y5_9EURO
MTLTTYPPTTDSFGLAALNISRLINRLEHNLLSPDADLKSLRRMEYERMRVSANIEYARTSLQALECNLPQIKPVDRRHELQSALTRNRQTLKRLQTVLDEIQSEAEARYPSLGGEWDDDDGAEDDADSEDLLGTPEGGSTADEAAPEDGTPTQAPAKDTPNTITTTSHPITTSTAEPSPTNTPPAPATTTLRNRHHNTPTPASDPTKGPTATGTSLHPNTHQLSNAETEQTLSSDRVEQENLTSSLLSLATQLKTSSQAFQASLDAEKSVLSRAAEGLDRTTGNLAAAERRMGMLRRMTEGKGWWGRMMLYAWIFALWVVAVLIVFVGPKLRF